MGQTTTAAVSSAVTEFYDRTLLTRALPYLAHDKFGQRRPIPTGNSKQIKFRKYNSLSAATTPLAEGVTPSSTALAVTDITATVAQYGAFVELSDMVSLTNVEPVLTEAAEVLGEQAGLSLDQIYRDVLVAGTGVLYSSGDANRGAVAHLLTTTDLDKAIRTLMGNNARMFTEIITATDGVGTKPIAAAYMGIVHPDVYYTLRGLTGFVDVHEYASQGAVMEGEVGAYKNIRFVASTNAKIFAGDGATGSAYKATGGDYDVYSTLIFGKDAYGITELQGNGLKNIVKPYGSGGTGDPLDQRATSGWKATTVCKILDDTRMIRIETAAAL